MYEEDCSIHLTENGLEIKGKCAEELIEVFDDTFEKSTNLESEIFACGCLNQRTGRMERALIMNSGNSTSVDTNGIKRICPEGTLQITYHTHPVSKQAKFSSADKSVIVDRFNEGSDDAHCVVGENVYDCIFRTKIRKRAPDKQLDVVA